MKTSLGLLSNSLVDSNSTQHYAGLKASGTPESEVAQLESQDQDLIDALSRHTRKVAKQLSPFDQAIENRFYHHMLLA